MLCWIYWDIFIAELRSLFFLLRSHGSLWKSGLLKALQQFALKTNDNFGFFFGMMHRPDTSIRGAWNAAGDDSECYNRTGSPIFECFKAISNLPLDNPRMNPPSANHNSNWGANCRVLCIHGLQPFLVWVYFPNMHIVNLGVRFKLDYYGCWQDEALDPQIILRWVALSDPKMVCHILICSTISSLASSQVRRKFLGPVICFGSNDVVIVSSVSQSIHFFSMDFWSDTNKR